MLKLAVPRLRLSVALLLPLALGVAAMSGCAVDPTREESTILASVPAEELDRAAALAAGGKGGEAAERYLVLAGKAQGQARIQLEIKAARAYLAAGRVAQVQQIAAALGGQTLTAAQREELRTLTAESTRLAQESAAGGYAAGDRVTILLPRGGRFASAAKAIREGIEAASRADSGGARPRLDFVDGAAAGRPREIARRAAAGGVRYLIGPLEKEAVDGLLVGPPLRVPTLALNEATREDRSAPNLYQFSLSPENEAVEVANQAYAAGLRRALVMAPDGPWGDRLANAFRRQWRTLGGTLAGQSGYSPSGAGVERTLPKALQSARPDLVFLVATADTARKLYPKVRAATAQSPLMVVSTSHVYAGSFDARRDAGLVGLYFIDIPWMFDIGRGSLPRRGGSDALTRLYAMGIDAYRLAPRLSALSANRGYYPGQTGELSVDSRGRIHRQLVLGRFTATGPRPADWFGWNQRPDTP